MQEKNQTRSRARQAGAGIDPNLRAFLDRVIVPALVREYLAKHEGKNNLTELAARVVDSGASGGPSVEELP